MKKFISKLFIFTIPLFIILLPPSWYLYQMKENFFDLESFLKKPSHENYLVGYIYNEKNYKFLKWKSIDFHPKSEVWTIGSSRSNEFRKEMFDKSFYNVGYTIRKVNEFLPFLKSVDSSKYPDVLIVTLDTWMFNAKYEKMKDVIDQAKWSKSFQMYPTLPTLKSTWKDIIINKLSINKKYTSNNFFRIGFNAQYKNSGFRADGSFYYGEQVSKLLKKDSTCSDYQFKQTLKRIDAGGGRFSHGNKTNPKTFEELKRFLVFCKEHKIKVVLILPPFPEITYNKMVTSGNFNYMKNIPKKCYNIAKEAKCEFYDYTKPKSFGSADCEFIDGFHGSEKVYLKMLIKILETKSVLNDKTNIDRLKKDLNTSISDYQVYKN